MNTATMLCIGVIVLIGAVAVFLASRRRRGPRRNEPR